jgi:hypothetical protein
MGFEPSRAPSGNPDVAALLEVVQRIRDIFPTIVDVLREFLTSYLRSHIDVFQLPLVKRKFDNHMNTVSQVIVANATNALFLQQLELHSLVGEELQYKKGNLEFFARLFLERVRTNWASARKVIDPLMKIINSILESLGFIPAAGAAKEIKDHIHAGLTADV